MAVLVVGALVVPTLTITGARVVGDGGLVWVILRACAPLAILPYSLAAIILVAATCRFRGTARSVTASSLVVVSSLLGLHVWWFTEPFLVNAPGSPSGEIVTVMTANLHIGRADPETILDAIDRDDVDLLVLDEITPASLNELDRAGLGRRLNYRVGTPDVGRDGIMVFANDPLHEVGEIDTATPGYDVEMATVRGPLRILAVHPTAPNNGVERWSRDLDLVVESARASSGSAVVAGDFNATLDHPQLQSLMDLDFRDASADAGLGWRPTWPSPGNVDLKGFGLPSLFGLDHIFVRGPLRATDAHTRIVPGTDHRALVTRLAWTDPGPPSN